MRIQVSILVLLVLLAAAVLLPASAQNAPTAASNPVLSHQIGGVTSAIAYDNGNLFFNVGPRLVRLAVSSSTALAPTLPDVYGPVLPGVPVSIKAANGYLYVALGKGGVAVVDETSLETLSVQTLPGTASAAAVAVSLQQLYVAAGTTGIIGYGIGSDKKTLTYQQTRSFSSPVRDITDVAVKSIGAGEYLFVTANNFAALPANRGGVLKFDITGGPNLGASAKSIQLDANSLAVTDAFAFVGGDGALYALDTANLGTTPGVSTTLSLGGRALKVALRPNASTAYVIDDFGNVNVVSIGAGSPPALSAVGTFSTHDIVKDIVAVEYASNANTYLYLADSGSGLSLASATQAAPQTVTPGPLSYVKPKPGVTSVVAAGYSQVFAFSLPSTLWTIDAGNVSSLSAVGSGQVPSSTIHALTAYTSSLLASNGPDGVSRYRLSPGSEPALTDTLATGGMAYDAAVVWPIAAVANGDSGLAVLDLSDPVTMTLAGIVPSPKLGAFTHVAAQGVFAYVADDGGVIEDDAALRIYDFTDPTAPIARGTLTQTGIMDVKVSGKFAFMAVGADGVRIADISNPDAPTIIDADDYTGTTSARSLVINENVLFVTGGNSGVQMLAVDPVTGQLSLIKTIPTSGFTTGLAWAPGVLYVADDIGGLVAIQIKYQIMLPMVSR
jgi:hypothetical protein